MSRWFSIRAALGIHPYRPGAMPPARVRRSIGYGARGTNGHTSGLDGLTPAERRVLENLIQEHRLLRGVTEDMARRERCRGLG